MNNSMIPVASGGQIFALGALMAADKAPGAAILQLRVSGSLSIAVVAAVVAAFAAVAGVCCGLARGCYVIFANVVNASLDIAHFGIFDAPVVAADRGDDEIVLR